jgi:hypothetical protein
VCPVGAVSKMMRLKCLYSGAFRNWTTCDHDVMYAGAGIPLCHTHDESASPKPQTPTQAMQPSKT